MGVREYLEEREKELVHQIDMLFIHIAQLRADLVPLEGELAEVRRAKNAIGSPVAALSFDETSDLGTSADAVIRQSRAHLIAPFITETPPAPAQRNAQVTALQFSTIVGSPYDKLTMKELIIKALSEHFHDGATTRQLLDFFRDAWGREIERTNLSPQLSRLFHDEEIGRSKEGAWFLLATRKFREGDTRFLKRPAEGD